MNDLKSRLTELSERGTPVGAEELRHRVMLDLARGSGRSGVPGWAIAMAAAAATIAVFGALSLLVGGSDGSIVPVGPTDTPSSTTVVTLVEQTAARTVFPDGPIGYGTGPETEGVIDATTSGGVLWAWDQSGRIWRHTGDGWEALPVAPGIIETVGYGGGTLWASVDTDTWPQSLSRLEGDEWVRVEGTPAHRFAVDPTSGVVWISRSEKMYRFEDGLSTDVGAPDAVGDGFSFVADVVVTGDGIVWADGFYGYVPMNGSLAAYRDGTGTWEIVAPWGGEPLPATSMTITSSGDLWVILVDWQVDPTADESIVDWALAHRDADTGAWTIHDSGLPDGLPSAMAADDSGVWLAQGGSMVENAVSVDGLHHFDGSSWTHYLKGAHVRDVVVAPDGTVWYLIHGLSPLDRR
jgi:hypothetical protein